MSAESGLKQSSTKGKTIVIGGAIVAILFLMVRSCEIRDGKAMIAVKGVLKAPGTADFQGTKIFWEQGDRTLVQVKVDAENSFGAKVRSEFCVCLRKEKGIHEPKFVRECRIDPSNKSTFDGEIASCTMD